MSFEKTETAITAPTTPARWRRAVAPLLALGLAALLSGCATVRGVDFDRAKVTTGLRLGTATKAEAVAALGAPRREQVLTLKKDSAEKELPQPAIVTDLYYYFQDDRAPGAGPDIEPSRSAALQFIGDRLMGYATRSSFRSDATDFDEDAVKRLERGRTTEAQLLQMLGQPQGRSLYPLARDAGGSAMAYESWRFSRTTRKGTLKVLRVFLDGQGVLTDYDLRISAH